MDRRHLRYLWLGLAPFTALGGCGWFDGDAPANSTKIRPGAERAMAPSNALPSASAGRQYDAPVAAIDETRSGPKIGSLVPDKGGQKAQLEAAAKEAAERDKAAREEREKQAEAERKAKEAEAKEPKDAKKPKEPLPKEINAPDQPPTQASAPPPAPVTSAPVPPPSAAP